MILPELAVEGLAVALGGAAGATLRAVTYVLCAQLQRRHRPSATFPWAMFPWATLLVNFAGCLLLGWIVGRVEQQLLPATAQALLGAGFCGALTTFSTFSGEALELWRFQRYRSLLAHFATNLGLGLSAALCGRWLAGG